MYLVEKLERAVYSGVNVAWKHPLVDYRLSYLRHKHEGNLAEISQRYGISVDTLTRQRDGGHDNPAYRFARDKALFDWLAANRAELTGGSWLDVGAYTGCVDVYLSEMLQSDDFKLCDVDIAEKAFFPVTKFSGSSLDFEAGSFDMVFFSYVLHHAAENTIDLLQDAHRIARKYVVILEDVKETDADYRWAYRHDKAGTFRGRREWKKLFAALNFTIVADEPLSCEVHSRHLFVVAPNRNP